MVFRNLYYLAGLVTAILLLVVTRHTFREDRGVQQHTVLMWRKNAQALAFGEKALLQDTSAVAIAAYFDGRKQHSHSNVTVIFAAVLQSLERNVTGCEVDEVQELNDNLVLVRPIKITLWLKKHRLFTHTELMVLCFDMKITKNSTVKLLLKGNGETMKIPVLKDIVLPVESTEQDEVMICATGFGSPENLDQWLLYQQAIGIKFIHLNIHISFVQNINKSETLRYFLESGNVTMMVWEEQLNQSQVFYHSQSFKYQDCLFRYQNVYKYILLIDFDEYFIPLGPQKYVHYYAKRLLGRRNIASVELPEKFYYCKIKDSENMTVPKDGNITRLYDPSYSSTDDNHKSIHLVKFVEEVSVHVGIPFRSHRGVAYNSPRQTNCYIAHISKYPKHTKKCKH